MAGGDKGGTDCEPVFCEVFTGIGDRLLEFFNQQRENIDLCDSLLTVDGVEFPAHTCVLGASSDLLLKKLMGVRKDNVSRLTVQNVSYKGFCPVFEYMYSGVLKFEISSSKDVRSCAQTLGLKELENFFENYAPNTASCPNEKGDVFASEAEGKSDEDEENSLSGWERSGGSQDSAADIGEVRSKTDLGGTLRDLNITDTASHGNIEGVQPSNTSSLSNSAEVDSSGLDDYLTFFASLSANAEPIQPAFPNSNPKCPAGNGDEVNVAKLHADQLGLYGIQNNAVKENVTNVIPNIEHGSLERSMSGPFFEPQAENTSNPSASSGGTFNDDSQRVTDEARENQKESPILPQKPSDNKSGNSDQENLYFSCLKQQNYERNDQQVAVDAEDVGCNDSRNLKQGCDIVSASCDSVVNEARTPPSTAEVGHDATNSNLETVGKKIHESRPKRRTRLRKRSTYSGDEETSTTVSSKSNNFVYVRSQTPVYTSSGRSAVQIGENLNQLLQKHGLSTVKLGGRITSLRPLQKRKRTTPRKIHRHLTTSKKSSTNEPSLARRKTRKQKGEGEKQPSDETRVKAYNCPLCPRGFFREPSLKKHCEGHAYGGIHKCHVCGRSYVRLCDFTRHVRSHGTLRCEYCEFTTKSQKLFVDHNEHKHDSPKPFRCHYPNCNFASSKLHDLDEHRLIHSEVKCFSCELCGKTFAQKGGLYSHMKSCMQKRDFLCDICGRAFNHLGSMKSHRRIHIGEKPFQCSECNARFSDHRNLKRHKRIHENAFPYACEFCDKRFRHSNSRKSHMNKQHFQTDAPSSSPDKLAKLSPALNSYMIPLQHVSPESFLTQHRPQLYNQQQNLLHPVFPGQIRTGPEFVNPIQQHSLNPQP